MAAASGHLYFARIAPAMCEWVWDVLHHALPPTPDACMRWQVSKEVCSQIL